MASRSLALSLPLALALLSACQLAPGGAPPAQLPTFRIQAAGGDAAAPVRASGEAIEGATAVRVPPPANGTATPAYDGQLTVKFGHVLGKAERRLLAVLADVDKLTIKLSGNGVSHTETISKAMLAGGMTSFTFSGLPAGALTVTIEALDAGGQVIGGDIQHATVTAGQTTVVTSTVRLNPPAAPPRVIVAGSGGSGGGTVTAGGITTNVTIVEGNPVIVPPIVAVRRPVGNIPTDGEPWYMGLTLARDGRLWLYDAMGDGDNGSHYFHPFDRGSGSFGSRIALHVSNMMPYHVNATDPGGRLLFTAYEAAGGSDHGFVRPDGTVASASYLPPGLHYAQYRGVEDLEADPQGRLWGVDQTGLLRFADTWATNPSVGLATPVVQHPLVGVGYELERDAAGNFWVACWENTKPSTHHVVACYDANFQLKFSHRFPCTYPNKLDIALDAQGDLWVAVPDQQAIAKIDAGGTIAGTFRSASRLNHVFVDANDHVWGYNANHWYDFGANVGAADELVMRLAPDGALLGYYAIGEGADLAGLVVTPDNHMWALAMTKGLIDLALPPLPTPPPAGP